MFHGTIGEIPQEKLVSAEEAAKLIQSGDRVYIGTCTSTAYKVARAIGERAGELQDVTIGSANTIKPLKIFEDPAHFRVCSYFLGPQERKAQALGMLDYTSVNLSQAPIWCEYTFPTDVAVLEVSLPDENGYACYGGSGITMHCHFARTAKKIILEVNENAPYCYGEDNLIHLSQADLIVRSDEELVTSADLPQTPEIQAISRFILDEIPDGACLQLGIGGIANAVGFGLQERNDLGIHSELMTDSMMKLMQNGNVTNRRKAYFPGKSVACFTLGSKALYDFVDHNPDMYYMPYDKVNRPDIIARNDNVISVNGAISIDLQGQVMSDNVNGVQFSGVGGQMDFVSGAQMSRGGKSFIAMTAVNVSKRTGARTSRIVPSFPKEASVTTPKSAVQYVVTEYGCVDLKKLTRRDRTRALISLAAPEFREQLTDEAKEMGLL